MAKNEIDKIDTIVSILRGKSVMIVTSLPFREIIFPQYSRSPKSVGSSSAIATYLYISWIVFSLGPFGINGPYLNTTLVPVVSSLVHATFPRESMLLDIYVVGSDFISRNCARVS